MPMLRAGVKSAVSAAALIVTLACDAPSAQPADYRLEPVAFTSSIARVRGLELTLDDPDHPQRPTMWEGPLHIRSAATGRSCDAHPSLIAKVFLDSLAQTVVVVSVSGSRTFVDFVATDTCRERWPRLDAATDGITAAGDRLTILPSCESDGTRARCSSGRVYEMQPAAAPRLLDSESRQLTKTRLGVEFTGQAWVDAPRTNRARVIAVP
ncbi:MAG: hypothetical protein QM736_28390 [Vicinamibacterales bacterium]